MGGLSIWHWIIVLIIVMLVFGTKKLRNIGEESAELIMAAKDGKRLNIVWESTDLIYHVMVLLAFYGMGIEDVSQEMRRREGISGIDEKKSRTVK